MLQSQGHGVRPGTGSELSADLFDVPGHRARRQAELQGDLVVARALGHQCQNLSLAPGKADLSARCLARLLVSPQWIHYASTFLRPGSLTLVPSPQ
jgi:hypothetical protein